MMRRLFLVVFIFVLFWSCSKIHPGIATPAYLQIDNYKVVVTDSSDNGQGTTNQKFTDVLVESGSTSYGYYPMPGKIAFPLSGSSYLIIRPVIKVNGVGAVRLDYPLMHGYDTSHALVAGQIKKITPVFKYYSTVNFKFMEAFEGLSTKMVNSNASDTFGVKIINNVSNPGSQMPGSGSCLLMRLDAAHQFCQAQSYLAFHLPNDGTSIFLEINYKCNTDFEVGLIGTNGGINGPNTDVRTVGGAVASAGWNKIYFAFSEVTRIPPTYSNYYLYFAKAAYDHTSTTNEIYIDNIKLISQY
jgi:hypothetical protein